MMGVPCRRKQKYIDCKKENGKIGDVTRERKQINYMEIEDDKIINCKDV